MTRRIKLATVAIAFFLLGTGTTAVMAQGGLTLEGLGEALARLTGRVDSIEERLSALEAAPGGIGPTTGTVAPGMYKVGVDISPGEYVGVAGDKVCYWARLSSLGGKLSDVIANGVVNENARFYVEIESSDYAFELVNCRVSPVVQVEADTPEPTSTRRATPTRKPTSTRRPTSTRQPTSTPQANTITITTASNVRSGPGTNYAIVGQSTVGTVYEVTGVNGAGDWYRIRYKGGSAWVWTGLTDNRNLSVPVVRTPTPPPRSRSAPPAAPTIAANVQRIIIDETRQSYWAAPSENDWRGTLVPGPGKYAVPAGEYVYVCTKTNNPFWHKILVPGAPDGWVWIRAVVYFLDEVYCDQ